MMNTLPIKPDWQRLFPDADYRLNMGLRLGDAASFWNDWSVNGSIAAERRHWLATAPEWYAGCLPEGLAARAEAQEWMRSFSAQPEPDWVLMSAGTTGEPTVVAGEVVFPSVWSLPDKLGLPMSSVHAHVPDLNQHLGRSIHNFLTHLKVGYTWQRENWGLAGDNNLNHHPSQDFLKLRLDARPEITWIRLEHQCLTRLSISDCILFGIRVTCHKLDEVARIPGMTERITRAIRTMPETVAQYKGILHARDSLLKTMG